MSSPFDAITPISTGEPRGPPGMDCDQMIDLHSHILPGIDDGSPDLATSLAMAEAFVKGGVEVVACTPHILPGLYHNAGPQIRSAVGDLQRAIDEAGIPLKLTTGADVHIAPGLVEGLSSGRILSLASSRYVLIEPPHHVAPARFEDTLFSLLLGGYVPIVTHPERLSWIRDHYPVFQRLVGRGVWLQLTSGSLAGKFGKSALYWSERMLEEGLVHILASDAHDVAKRPPDLAVGRELAARRVGDEEAGQLVLSRPLGILGNEAPSALSRPRGAVEPAVQGARAAGSRAGAGHDDSGTRAGAIGGTHGFVGRLRRLFQ
ncbi:MAG: CpsB/CapC family capsule biosynthesis tyrosine phosphatase [Hyphomicrobiaceae bacterium]|nr:CpsB/CapC family capsule biosynthesis tyrosine phosphatase [Hyphomicrobiaceae bacterium]